VTRVRSTSMSSVPCSISPLLSVYLARAIPDIPSTRSSMGNHSTPLDRLWEEGAKKGIERIAPDERSPRDLTTADVTDIDPQHRADRPGISRNSLALC